MKRLSISVLVLFAAAAAVATGARADGLPVLGVDVGSSGVESGDGSARYVTIPSGRTTIVERVNPKGGSIDAYRLVHGTFTIPAVAYDASAGGLSADGKTLVLIAPRTSFPRQRTSLLVLDTSRLQPLQVVKLEGDFSFDAVSPRGALLYLIQYVSPTDPTRYLVRAFDLERTRLLSRPIVDPRERSDKMRGNPLTRLTSSDGRWAYTLYDGAGATPFVHALDTATRTAHCIDLPSLRHFNALWSLRFHRDRAGALTLANGTTPVLAIDTRTFVASRPSPPAVPAAPRGATPWLLVALSILGSLAAAAALAILLRRVTRPSRSPARAS